MIKLPASTTAGGMCMAAPDTCKTPAPPSPSPVPIPYPNMGQCTTAVSTSIQVMAENRPFICANSTIPRTNGDEPGVAGGVISGVFGDQVAYKSSSSKVFIEGKKVCSVTAMTGQNGSNANAIGAQAVPSQVKVFVSL